METIHIALTFDDNYLEYSIVLMTSILANKSDEKIHFHILDGGLCCESKRKIFEVQNCEITFHIVNNKIFENYQKSDYYPSAMLWTMILPDLIKVDKLLYLDVDMVVNSSLIDLWNTELEDNYIAAVEDANGVKYAKRFFGNKDIKFFNTGVMLLNCKKWRENNITEKAVEMSMKNTGTKWGYDQTVLNILFMNAVKYLNLKWNLQYCPLNVWATYKDIEEYKNAIDNPSIIHYVGDYKPWKKGFGYLNPKQDDYFKYHKLTSYAYRDYKKWKQEDKKIAYKGLIQFVKRYPLFFCRVQFWKNLKSSFAK